MPNVRGKKAEDARRILEEAGLKVKTDTWIAGDRVVGQQPKAGTVVDEGSTVEILLSLF